MDQLPKIQYGGGNFCTPIAKKTRSCSNNAIAALRTAASFGFGDSPFVVPPSPMMKKLGCGTQVTVYRYKRHSSAGSAASPWAIKKAKCGRTRTPVIKRLKTEGEILRQLNHPNIVKFKKLTMTDKGEICLSMEEFGKGLDDIINSRQISGELFSSRQIMAVTWSIANALDYLHNTIKLLHGDIKGGNVLVRGDFEEIKLCDFGVAIFLKDDLSGPKNASDTYVGSEPWLSKEIMNDQKITDKADIFAYGLLIWEMLALDVPHVALMSAGEELDGTFSDLDGSDVSIPDAYFDALGTRPPLPDINYPEKYDTVIGMFLCCTNEDYSQRPSAERIVESLSEHFLGEKKRKKLDHLPESFPDEKRRKEEASKETDKIEQSDPLKQNGEDKENQNN